MEQWECSCIAGGNSKLCSNFGKKFGSFKYIYIYTHTLIIKLSKYTHRYLRNKTLYRFIQKPAHNVLVALFIIAPNSEPSKCASMDKWVGKVLHLYDGILLSDTKEQTIDVYSHLDKSQRRYAEWTKSTSKNYCMTFQEVRTVVMESRSGLPMVWGGEHVSL